MAISRASFENIPINLITSVPSIETYENIKKKKYTCSKLVRRYQNASLPKYEIINLNNVKMDKQSWLSKEIIQKVNFHLKKNDQVLFFALFLPFKKLGLIIVDEEHDQSYKQDVFYNAKNVSNNLSKRISACPNCSINLVYHKNKNNLLCHYCGFKSFLKRECSKEGFCEFIFCGPGVERISEEVKKSFPSKKKN